MELLTNIVISLTVRIPWYFTRKTASIKNYVETFK